VDVVSRTITLDDGGVIRLTEEAWRRENLDQLRPGARVYVSPAAPSPDVPVPSAYRPEPSDASAVRSPGRVVQTDDSRAVTMDGTTIFVPIGTMRGVGTETVAVGGGRPGADMVVEVEQVVAVAGLNAGDHVVVDRRDLRTDRDRMVRNRDGLVSPSLPSYEFPASAN